MVNMTTSAVHMCNIMLLELVLNPSTSSFVSDRASSTLTPWLGELKRHLREQIVSN